MRSYWLTSDGHIWTERDERSAPTVTEFPDEFSRRDLGEPDEDGLPDVTANGVEIPWSALTERERSWLLEQAERAASEAVDEVRCMAAESRAGEVR